MTVGEIMTRGPICCTPTDSAEAVARAMCAYNVGSLPVIVDQQSRVLIGVITDRDLCCSIVSGGLDPKGTPIEMYVRPNPVTCHEDESLDNCERAMEIRQIRRIPVIDALGRCVGIVSQANLALRGEPEKVSKRLLKFPNLRLDRSRPSSPCDGHLWPTRLQKAKMGIFLANGSITLVNCMLEASTVLNGHMARV
jgi:CBS domain-containing protein